MKKLIFQKLSQKKGADIYIGKMNVKDLFSLYKISFLKEEDFENVSIKEQVEIATNYNFEAKQRDESPKRIKNISKYIETDLGIFPNAIILGNLDKNKGISFEKIKDYDIYYLINSIKSNDEKLFIIDGQHRLKGVALYYYSNLLDKLIDYYAGNFDKIKLLREINSEKKPIKKIKKIIDVINQYSVHDLKINTIVENASNYDLPVVIIDNLTNSKIIEIFTDINGLVVPLNSNIIRFYYGYFTNKHPKDFSLLNISVNIGKLLNENMYSSIYGLVKMPYKSKVYEEKFKGYSQVSISAFCQRFEERGKFDIESIRKSKNNYDYFNKTIGIFIYHRYLKGDVKQLSPLNEDSIIESINFLFLIFSYSYMEAKNIFDIGVLKYIKDAEISKKEEKFLNIKNYKFIDSTSNELYFYLIDYIIKVVIQANDFDIEKIFKLDKTQIKKEVSSAFKYFEKSLVHIYESNQYFIKGEQDGTGGGKSKRVVEIFNDSLKEFLNQNQKDDFNNLINKYYGVTK